MAGGAPICFPHPEFHVVRAVEGDGISVGHPFGSDGLEPIVCDRPITKVSLRSNAKAIMLVNSKSLANLFARPPQLRFFFVESEDFFIAVDFITFRRVYDWFLRLAVLLF